VKPATVHFRADAAATQNLVYPLADDVLFVIGIDELKRWVNIGVAYAALSPV
jgi:hypothetical protein